MSFILRSNYGKPVALNLWDTSKGLIYILSEQTCVWVVFALIYSPSVSFAINLVLRELRLVSSFTLEVRCGDPTSISSIIYPLEYWELKGGVFFFVF